MIFGGIVFAVFLAFGTNTGQGLHWAVKEYSDNVADVCSVITIAYLAYTYRMAAYSAMLVFKTRVRGFGAACWKGSFTTVHPTVYCATCTAPQGSEQDEATLAEGSRCLKL